MKAYAIRDQAMPGHPDLAYLLYYEKSRRFCIELCRDTDAWNAPPILSFFAGKGQLTIGFHWSRIWVEQRIIPPDRQNLGMILREFQLKEYDPHALLNIAHGRCAQDDCYLTPLREEQYPPELAERLRGKIHDVVAVSATKLLIIYQDGHIDQLEEDSFLTLNSTLDRLLHYYQGLSGLQVSPGGQGLEWAPGQEISLAELRRAAVPARIFAEDMTAYIQHNLISTGEAAELLGCSRQNIADMIRRGKLTPIREEKNNSLFLRADILSRLRD